MIYFHSDGSVQYSGYDLSFSYVTSGKYRADVSVELSYFSCSFSLKVVLDCS